MTTTVEVTYENGALKLLSPLPLEERTRVMVTVRTGDELQGWEDSADDVFNELLDR